MGHWWEFAMDDADRRRDLATLYSCEISLSRLKCYACLWRRAERSSNQNEFRIDNQKNDLTPTSTNDRFITRVDIGDFDSATSQNLGLCNELAIRSHDRDE